MLRRAPAPPRARLRVQKQLRVLLPLLRAQQRRCCRFLLVPFLSFGFSSAPSLSRFRWWRRPGEKGARAARVPRLRRWRLYRGAAMAWWGTDADGRPWAFGAVRGRVAASQRGTREARVRRARGRAVKGRARRSPQFVAERRRDGEARRRRAEQAEAASGGWGKSNRGAWQVGPACHRLNERVSGGGDGLVLLGRRMSSRPGPCCLVNWPSAN